MKYLISGFILLLISYCLYAKPNGQNRLPEKMTYSPSKSHVFIKKCPAFQQDYNPPTTEKTGSTGRSFCSFNVNKIIQWTVPSQSVVRVYNDGSLAKPSTAKEFEDGLTFSKDTLLVKDSVWINFTAADINSQYLIGYASCSHKLLEKSVHKIFIKANECFVIETDGDGFYTKKLISTFSAGDTFRISISARGVNYFRSGKIIYNSQMLNGNKYRYEANINYTSTKITNITGSTAI